MRITFVLPTKEISGGIRSTFEIVNVLVERGWQVCVIYPLIPANHSSRLLDGRELERRARSIYSNLRKGNRVDWFDLKAEVIRVPWLSAARIPPGDVIVATWWADAYVVNHCSEDKGVKFHLVRGYEVWGGEEDAVNEAYRLPLCKIVTSNWLKDLIEGKFGVKVYGPTGNGVDLKAFRMQKESFEANDYRRIGLLYRRLSCKGMRDGLQALLAVQEKHPDFQCVIFGEKPAPDDAESIKKLRKLEYHELPHGDELSAIYGSLDVSLFPSLSEGYGLPPMEAMACGAACVTTIVGGEDVLRTAPSVTS